MGSTLDGSRVRFNSMLAETHDSSSPLQARARSKRAIFVFIALAFVWSWGVGFAATQVKAYSPGLNVALMILAGFGPSLAGIAVVAIFSNRAGLRVWAGRCLDWRVGWRWFVLAFLAPPALMLCALAVHAALTGEFPALPASGHIPLAIANFGLVLLIGGPLGEEFGWRGYLMPAIAAKLNWRAASLLIGAVWGVWHLPLFYMADTAQSLMPIPVFMLNILAGSVLFGWLFERTLGSVLPALVLHTSLNAWAGILSIIRTAATGRPYILATGLLVLAAAALLLKPAFGKAQRQPLNAAALIIRK
jgi:membrane protease YdiL (CAAX protease family)